MAGKWLIDNDRYNECCEEICESYCKFLDIAPTQERLERHCEECPLNNLLDDEWWNNRGKEDEADEWERDYD